MFLFDESKFFTKFEIPESIYCQDLMHLSDTSYTIIKNHAVDNLAENTSNT